MRWTLALVPLLMLSGCLGPTDGLDDDANRGSGPGDGAAMDPAPRKGVVFFDAAYQLLPTSVTELDVQVPEGARGVRVEVSVQGASNPLDEAVVTLSGCGQGHVTWNPGPNVVVSGGGSWREADLCAEGQPGSHTLNLDGGATAMAGRVLLRADLP